MTLLGPHALQDTASPLVGGPAFNIPLGGLSKEKQIVPDFLGSAIEFATLAASEQNVTFLLSYDKQLTTTKWFTENYQPQNDIIEIQAEAEPPGVKADTLHEDIQIMMTRAGTSCDLLSEAEDALLKLKAKLENVLQRPVAAMFIGDNSCIFVRICVSDVATLHGVRDLFLRGLFTQNLEEELKENAQLKDLRFEVDRTHFAEKYEQCILALSMLTPHQEEKLKEVEGVGRVLLLAPAGAGKTYVALHKMLALLRSESSLPQAQVLPRPQQNSLPSASSKWRKNICILFAARNIALCIFVVKWIMLRAVDQSERNRFLERLHVLFGEMEVPHFIVHEGDLLSPRPLTTGAPQYTLTVLDEAHHVCSDPELKLRMQTHLHHHYLLLGDVSQTLGSKLPYPEVDKVIHLTEVVRSSRRIVQGAQAFQISPDQESDELPTTTCHHQSDGPPLKTFLFDVNKESRVKCYTAETLRAIQHVTGEYKGLSLHDRLAIIVPDDTFRDELKAELSEQLASAYPDRKFELVDAKKACATFAARDEGPTERAEWLVLDTMDRIDGLERLIVIAIDLDAPLEGGSQASNPLLTRSRLYRAMTRAHMMVLVVNELVPGGWLAWLNGVRLKNDQFDRGEEGPNSSAKQLVAKRLQELRDECAKRGLELTPTEESELRQYAVDPLQDLDRELDQILVRRLVVKQLDENTSLSPQDRSALISQLGKQSLNKQNVGDAVLRAVQAWEQKKQQLQKVQEARATKLQLPEEEHSSFRDAAMQILLQGPGYDVDDAVKRAAEAKVTGVLESSAAKHVAAEHTSLILPLMKKAAIAFLEETPDATCMQAVDGAFDIWRKLNDNVRTEMGSQRVTHQIEAMEDDEKHQMNAAADILKKGTDLAIAVRTALELPRRLTAKLQSAAAEQGIELDDLELTALSGSNTSTVFVESRIPKIVPHALQELAAWRVAANDEFHAVLAELKPLHSLTAEEKHQILVRITIAGLNHKRMEDVKVVAADELIWAAIKHSKEVHLTAELLNLVLPHLHVSKSGRPDRVVQSVKASLEQWADVDIYLRTQLGLQAQAQEPGDEYTEVLEEALDVLQHAGQRDTDLMGAVQQALRSGNAGIRNIIKQEENKRNLKLSQAEVERIVARARVQVRDGMSREVAVRAVLPREQTVWETSGNSTVKGSSSEHFNPLASRLEVWDTEDNDDNDIKGGPRQLEFDHFLSSEQLAEDTSSVKASRR